MASSYSTDLKLEIQVTGENAGTWGDITNTNLVILQQAIAGYESVALNATTGVTLTYTNGALSNGKNAIAVAQLSFVNTTMIFLAKTVLAWIVQLSSITVALCLTGLAMFTMLYFGKIGSKQRQ